MNSYAKGAKAFTLIELLVVIAIIAILAAILFPVFAQAKLAAKKTASLSGLKQLALGLQMYSNDFDDTAVPDYGYVDGSVPGDTDVYHYTNTWVGRTYPYVKNESIYFDKTIADPTLPQYVQDPYYPTPQYTYAWQWVASLSLNVDGYSNYDSTGTSCLNPDSAQPHYVYRTLTAIDSPAQRLAITPTRYGSLPWSWLRFYAIDAAWPYADAYANTFSWYQLVYDSRKQYNQRFIGAYVDGHAANYGPEKFVKAYYFNPSQSQASSYDQFCSVMDSENLWTFWGQGWSPN